ncbi:hypothetical protein L249_7029 [Ophiocordyceps polyrhachis-furcata BCC 54312]|uniref:Uncharacterized protein n=1 Tax=Ophiocordyceps polyrhachis-furcata BCC 54312 TaxID=1330021 RepID=A0A367LJU1_9HYPO|nr:hypothetical protein L249_7029 [Ophiocordyceps polyrhachis-furcata BCC 54312]
MQFKQLLVAALFTLGSATAIPNPNAGQDVEVRDLNTEEPRSLEARDKAAVAGKSGKSWHRRHRCYDNYYDWEGRCCRWHNYRNEYYSCREYWYEDYYY